MLRLRLDKMLAHMGYGTRNEIKKLLRRGTVTVDGETVKSPELKVDPEASRIFVGTELVRYREFIYLMMNKPAGAVSSVRDEAQETVVDLLERAYQVFHPFPVGRLDKDTEGLLFLTNDGQLGHRLLSPKKCVDKIYVAEITEPVSGSDVAAFADGIRLEDGICLPAGLRILGEDPRRAEVTLREGRYHQVKRMFQSRGKEVLYLKRISMGGVSLDESLKPGEYRELTSEELKILTNGGTSTM
jgi:16S rRNA pseudouridine516 synthase